MAIIEWKIKRFNELSLTELYAMLELRSEVFVVEQNCVYQDIDGKDQRAIHLLGEINGVLVAYARLFRPNDYFEEASIGRVIVKPSYRELKLGHELMTFAIKAIKDELGETKITISAQLYLKKFYQTHGFVPTSDMYLEDDIPHIQMKKS
jgi:ElaA protein